MIKDAKKVFREKGTCSQTFFHLLDREFEQVKETEECAADSLAGGIMQRGNQCGMLWGASLAIGAEAYRRCNNMEQAMKVAVRATKEVMVSFLSRENTFNCRDITHCDFSNKWSFAKYFFSGRFLYCFKMAEQWAPEAIESAIRGLEIEESSDDRVSETESFSLNCASLVAKKLGASEQEMVMVAGFAGGMGLSGEGCGALSAAIWIRSLDWCRENASKNSFKNPNAVYVVEAFEEATDGKILCSELAGVKFNSLEEHCDFIEKGGCQKWIETLGKSVSWK